MKESLKTLLIELRLFNSSNQGICRYIPFFFPFYNSTHLDLGEPVNTKNILKLKEEKNLFSELFKVLF